jgi:beta-fructofuranosidase
MSLPIHVSILADGKLGLEPVKELGVLRQEHFHFENLNIPETGLPLDIRGDCLEIHLQFSPSLNTEAGLILRASVDGQDQTRIIYDPSQQQLLIHRFNPGTDVDVDNQCAPLALSPGEPLSLRVFLDHSVLEIFANHHTCLVSRVYPIHETSNHIALFTQDNPAVITNLDIWKLQDIWR